MTNLNRTSAAHRRALGAVPSPAPAHWPLPHLRRRPAPDGIRRQRPRWPGDDRRRAGRRVRLVDARRAEGRHHHQPDRHPHQPAHASSTRCTSPARSTSSASSDPSTASAAPRRRATRRATTSTRAPGSWSTTPTAPTRRKMTELFRTAGVETVVFDIQDVGSRFYTYIWTMYTAMRAAVAVGARFVVLDRPNPIGGTARGPMMTTPWTSGVGAKEIVQAHGMTVGELARFFDGEFLARRGRRPPRRAVRRRGQGLAPRRPVCRHRAAVGHAEPQHADARHRARLPRHRDVRGDQPLRGPRHDAAVRAHRRALRRLQVGRAPCGARPAGRRLPRGVLHADVQQARRPASAAASRCTSPTRRPFDPIRVRASRCSSRPRRSTADFAWRYDSYDPARPYWIDKLTGSQRLRTQISAGASADEVVGAWRDELAAFDARRQQYLHLHRPVALTDPPDCCTIKE